MERRMETQMAVRMLMQPLAQKCPAPVMRKGWEMGSIVVGRGCERFEEVGT